MIIRSVILTSLLTLAAPLRSEHLDTNLRPLIPQKEIAAKIQEVAQEITQEYKNKDLVVVMVMKGALCLTADLIRAIDLPLDVEYVQCSSYGSRGIHRGELKVIGLDRINLAGRDVLIVDDIFDTGHTMTALIETLKKQEPRSLKTLVLLKKEVPNTVGARPDYVLFDIANEFVVGYGLDFKEQYRNLPGVFILE